VKIDNWRISYIPETGDGFLQFDTKTYYPAIPIGAFVDVDSLPEVQSVVNESVYNESNLTVATVVADWIAYDESVGAGSFWIKMDIGNKNANSELDNVVACFKDSDGDMEGDELTGFAASYDSGTTKISIPGELIGYWKDGMGSGAKRCFQIADELGPSEKARWTFTLTVSESNWAELNTTYGLYTDGEEFEFCFDDLGDYSKRQYPSSDVKASSECLHITAMADSDNLQS
jgi:hypothetical protein